MTMNGPNHKISVSVKPDFNVGVCFSKTVFLISIKPLSGLTFRCFVIAPLELYFHALYLRTLRKLEPIPQLCFRDLMQFHDRECT